MIGIKYEYVKSNNNRIMEDRIADNAVGGEDGALITGNISNRHEGVLVNASSSTKKPSLLRASLLRRTTTRVTNKRSPPATAAMEKKHRITIVASTDIPVGFCGCCDATPQISSSSGRDKTSSSHEIDTATTRTPADDVVISNTKTFQTVDDCDSDNGNDNNIQDDTSSHDENNDLNISVNVSVDEDEVEMELNGPTRVEQLDQQTIGIAATTIDTQSLLQPDQSSCDEEEVELGLDRPTRVKQPDPQTTVTAVNTATIAAKTLSKPDQSSCDEEEEVELGLNRPTRVKQPDQQTIITTTTVASTKSLSKPDQSCDEEEVKLSRPARVKQPDQQTTVPTATVASTNNLSIVVNGNDIVVEYRDDNGSERKKSSHQALQNSFGGDAAVKALSAPAANLMVSTQKQTARRRARGIMKRPRDSNLTYHHPRRPQPPPLPPPGYRETTSPLSWMTASTADSSEDPYAERQRHFLNAPPTAITTTKKKRVKFDEKLLSDQYQSSKLRRRAKYEQRRSFWGILSMAMPVIMPYLIAVLILIASSMIPLPATTQRRQQSSNNLTLLLKPELANGRKNKRGSTRQSKMPTSPPIFIDIASRMWDERTKLEADVDLNL